MKMNKLFYGLGVVSLALLINACGSDETGLAPEITFDQASLTVTPVVMLS